MKRNLVIVFILICVLAGGYVFYKHLQERKAAKDEQLDTIKVCIEAMSDFQQFFEAESFEMAVHCYDGGYDLLTGFEPAFDDLVSQKEELIKLYEDDRVLKQYGIAKKRVEDSQFN